MAVIFFMFCSSAFCSDIELAKKSTLETILKKGELWVGFDSGYMPFEMTDKKGRFVGFDIDIAIYPDVLVDRARRFLTENRDRPFFLYLATHDIHVPRVPHPRFAGKSGMGPRGDAILQLGRFYASALVDSGVGFDMLFGPAYKGIPLAAVTAADLVDTLVAQADGFLYNMMRALAGTLLEVGRGKLAPEDVELELRVTQAELELVADDPAIYAEMGRLARQKLVQYWPYALLGTGVGAWRMFGLTRSLPGWFAPVELLYHALLYGLAA